MERKMTSVIQIFLQYALPTWRESNMVILFQIIEWTYTAKLSGGPYGPLSGSFDKNPLLEFWHWLLFFIFQKENCSSGHVSEKLEIRSGKHTWWLDACKYEHACHTGSWTIIMGKCLFRQLWHTINSINGLMKGRLGRPFNTIPTRFGIIHACSCFAIFYAFELDLGPDTSQPIHT